MPSSIPDTAGPHQWEGKLGEGVRCRELPVNRDAHRQEGGKKWDGGRKQKKGEKEEKKGKETRWWGEREGARVPIWAMHHIEIVPH